MISNDIQKLEPGSLVQLIEVDCSAFGGDVLRFHGHNIAITEEDIKGLVNPVFAGSLVWLAGSEQINAGATGNEAVEAKKIYWQGEAYSAWPCKIEGIESNSSGQPGNPVLSVGNIDGTISAACLFFDDLLQAVVKIRQTFSKYLDSENFEGGNPDADPSQESVETWFVDRKTSETNEAVQWELSSPGDVSGQLIPARIITGMCEWAMRNEYRGPDCGYTGSAMFTLNDEPTTDPALDQCAGLTNSCKIRFGEDNELPFGGFPGASLMRT